jgi:hypothetical protein
MMIAMVVILPAEDLYLCGAGLARDPRSDDIADSTSGDGRPVWLGRLDKVRNVVRQEMTSRQLDRHLRMPPASILDAGPARAAAHPCEQVWQEVRRHALGEGSAELRLTPGTLCQDEQRL